MTWQRSAALQQSAPNLHADDSLQDLGHFSNSTASWDLCFKQKHSLLTGSRDLENFHQQHSYLEEYELWSLTN